MRIDQMLEDAFAGAAKEKARDEELKRLRDAEAELNSALAGKSAECFVLRQRVKELRAVVEYIATGGEDWKDCARKARTALENTKG